jgi:hypothetical protein
VPHDRIDYHCRMTIGTVSRSMNFAKRIAILCMLACLLSVSAPALAQTTPLPEAKPFQPMETPGAPANLVTPPATSLITPSLLTPPTGVLNPPAGFSGGKVVMKQSVWQDYLRYLREDVSVGYGFFMITFDGSASDVKQCLNYTCQISTLDQATAVKECQARRNNRRCFVFAEGRHIKYGYQVVP